VEGKPIIGLDPSLQREKSPSGGEPTNTARKPGGVGKNREGKELESSGWPIQGDSQHVGALIGE